MHGYKPSRHVVAQGWGGGTGLLLQHGQHRSSQDVAGLTLSAFADHLRSQCRQVITERCDIVAACDIAMSGHEALVIQVVVGVDEYLAGRFVRFWISDRSCLAASTLQKVSTTTTPSSPMTKPAFAAAGTAAIGVSIAAQTSEPTSMSVNGGAEDCRAQLHATMPGKRLRTRLSSQFRGRAWLLGFDARGDRVACSSGPFPVGGV